MRGLEKFNSLVSLITYFKDDNTCKQFLKEQRWGDDVVCPYCGQHRCHTRSNGQFRCPNCLNNFSVLVGTVFENTKVSLVKWFAAMYLISSHKKGVSSHQLAKDIDVTQKTAWNILQKVRSLFKQDDSVTLSEDVECDEAYIGGRERNRHESRRTEGTQGRSVKTKTPVFGMVQRNGSVIAVKTADTKSATIMPIIRQFVKEGARIFTDEYIGYRSLDESVDGNSRLLGQKGDPAVCFRRKLHGQRAGVTFVRLYVVFLTIDQIVIHRFVESVGQLLDAFPFKIDKAVDAFNFSEEHAVFLAESYRSDVAFVSKCVHTVHLLFFYFM